MPLKDESFISLNQYEIAVVDDDRFYHGKIKELLLSFFPNADMHCFISGDEILKDDKEYSFLIIDVLLGGENGITLSDSLKRKAPYIIYYSEAAETIRRAFGYNTIGFILKSDPDEYIKNQFKQYNDKYFSNTVRLNTVHGEMDADLSRIVYVELKERKMIAHFSDGKTIQIYGSLNKIKMSSQGKLIPANKSVLVNPGYIQHIDRNDALLSNGERIDLSRRNRRSVEKIFMKRFL